MSEISKRILELLIEKNISYGELSKLTNIPKSALQRYATGETEKIPIDRLELIAKYLNVDAAYLMGWTGESALISDDYKYYEVPRFESIAAGFGVIANAIRIGSDFLPLKNKFAAAETMTVIVKGDSMYPKIEDGDVIAVKRQTSVDSGTLAAILIDETDAVVKKVTYGPDWIILHSFNPEYMDREFRGPEVQRIRVLGKVTKIIKEV